MVVLHIVFKIFGNPNDDCTALYNTTDENIITAKTFCSSNFINSSLKGYFSSLDRFCLDFNNFLMHFPSAQSMYQLILVNNSNIAEVTHVFNNITYIYDEIINALFDASFSVCKTGNVFTPHHLLLNENSGK